MEVVTCAALDYLAGTEEAAKDGCETKAVAVITGDRR